MPRGSVLGSLVALACLAAGAPAGAATTFGSTLQGPPNINSGTDTISANLTSPGISAAAPSSGVVTAMRVHHGAGPASPGMYAYRILSGDASPFVARPATPSGANDTFLSWPPNATDGISVYFPTDENGQRVGIPITAGEHLALWSEKMGDNVAAPSFWSNVGGGSGVYHTGDHTTGSAAYTTTDRHVMVQGTLEPDADGDRFGDESQDLCPALSGSDKGCPPGTTAQIVQTTVSGLAQFGKVTLSKDRKKLRLGVSCPAGRPKSCAGKASAATADKITLHRATAAKKAVVKLGSASFKVKAGASKTVTIKLSSKTRKRIRSLRKLRLKLTLTESASTKKTL